MSALNPVDSIGKAKEAIVLAEKKVCAVVPKIPFVLELKDMPGKIIPELGILGRFNKSKNLMTIWIDGKHPNIVSNLEEEIVRTFSHEYMHAYREEKIPWETGTLLASFVSEGLCQSSELEILGYFKPAIYATQLSEADIRAAWAKAQPLLNETKYDFDAWFFGTEEGIRRWTGYSLGFWLVQNHMKRTGKKASELAHAKPEAFLP